MTEAQKARHRIAQAKYQKTDKGRATWTRYNATEKARECWRRYNKKDKSRARCRRYKQSEAGQIIAYINARKPETRLSKRLAKQERRRG